MRFGLACRDLPTSCDALNRRQVMGSGQARLGEQDMFTVCMRSSCIRTHAHVCYCLTTPPSMAVIGIIKGGAQRVSRGNPMLPDLRRIATSRSCALFPSLQLALAQAHPNQATSCFQSGILYVVWVKGVLRQPIQKRSQRTTRLYAQLRGPLDTAQHQ